MSHRIVFVVVLAMILVAPGANAREYGVGIRAGTHGLGAEGAVGLTEWFSLRGGIYAADVSRDFEEGGIDYDGDLTLGGVGLVADFFPMRGQFRFSAGLLSNENEIDITASPTESQEIGGTVYTPAEIGTLSGNVEFDSTAPYAGIGWGNLARGRRVGFVFDVGVLFQGSGDVSLTSNSQFVDIEDLRAEEREIEDEIDNYDFWPVISVGVAIRF